MDNRSYVGGMFCDPGLRWIAVGCFRTLRDRNRSRKLALNSSVNQIQTKTNRDLVMCILCSFLVLTLISHWLLAIYSFF